MILRQLVAQGDPTGLKLATEIQAALAAMQPDRLDVAVAYATKSGLNALRNSIGTWPGETRWVIGLDDAITEPDAIDELIAMPNAQVWLASLSSEGRRFHPKLYCFWTSTDAESALAVIGSANMTKHGLKRNGEMSVLLIAESADEAELLKDAWEAMKQLGSPVPNWDLAGYRAKHAKARRARRLMAKIDILPLQPEAEEDTTVATPAGSRQTVLAPPASAPTDYVTASVAWTEGATPSAGGRDLEFPRKMMPFFGLNHSPTIRMFRMKNGQVFDLTFTMRTDNQMWRLLFSRDAIFAGNGRETLRPLSGVTRSDLAIVFERATGGADFNVDFVVIGSPQHAQLIARSKAIGGLDHTRNPGGRYFGYF